MDQVLATMRTYTALGAYIRDHVTGGGAIDAEMQEPANRASSTLDGWAAQAGARIKASRDRVHNKLAAANGRLGDANARLAAATARFGGGFSTSAKSFSQSISTGFKRLSNSLKGGTEASTTATANGNTAGRSGDADQDPSLSNPLPAAGEQRQLAAESDGVPAKIRKTGLHIFICVLSVVFPASVI